jgi:Na+/H+ antiporter NhaD/arsenite permease-like protein
MARTHYSLREEPIPLALTAFAKYLILLPMERALTVAGPLLFGIPVTFLLFGAVLAGIVLFQRRALEVALVGLGLILAARVGFSQIDLAAHLAHEWAKLFNLFGLLVGFALLADHFEASHLTDLLPDVLPRGARGCFTLLVLVWLLSGILDNIAAAIVGATVAAGLFGRRVHLGYLAAIVAAANAGGAGSVFGDTTTTMMWIAGVSPLAVLPAYLGSGTALVVFGTFASLQQAKHAPIDRRERGNVHVDGRRLAIVVAALVASVVTNIIANGMLGRRAERFPFLAVALWLVLIAGALLRPFNWKPVPGAAKGGLFLLALVLSASLMPVDALPMATWRTTLVLGIVSSIFDNIPLMKMALEQRGYDSALLAYSVGMGGSMVWFGSSAGVAVSGLFPEARSVLKWLRHAWYVPVAFLIGYLTLYGLRGWNP